MQKLNIEIVKKSVLDRGYKWFNDLNIVWIRSKDKTVNTFNDFATISWCVNGVWKFACYPGTTDPGLYWLQNPENIKGTAIVKPAQNIDCWTIGLHHGYVALVQVKPITVYRDANRNSTIEYGSEDTGIFGINSHRANATGVSIQVDKWSAGCLVIASSKNQDAYINVCELFNKKYYSITLLTEDEITF